MNLTEFAQSVAIKVNKEENFEFVESLKFDILGYRASIISSMDDKSISDMYYQTFNNFTFGSYNIVKIPTPLTFKDGSIKINALVRFKNRVKRINIISEEKGIYIEHRRFSSKEPFFILSSNTLIPYNFNPTLISDLSIKGIYSNPLELNTLATQNNCSTESKCIVDNDLIIEDSLYQKIVIFLYKQLGVENNVNEIRNTQV